MRKAVQHFCILTEPLNGQAVVFLIQEKSRFLSVLYIYQIADAVFLNLYLGIKRLSEKALTPLHPLFFPFLCIASLIDAPDCDAVLGQYFLEKPDQRLFHPVNAKGQGLDYQNIGKFIYYKARQKIRFPENHTAGAGIHGRFAVILGPLQAHPKKRTVNLLLGAPRHHAHPYF